MKILILSRKNYRSLHLFFETSFSTFDSKSSFEQPTSNDKRRHWEKTRKAASRVIESVNQSTERNGLACDDPLHFDTNSKGNIRQICWTEESQWIEIKNNSFFDFTSISK